MSSETVQRVIAVVREAARAGEDEEITAETPLIGGGLALDSASVLELLVGLENEFDMEIGADELLAEEALKTIGSLADFIDRKAGAGG
jgi:acyl carrier protein